MRKFFEKIFNQDPRLKRGRSSRIFPERGLLLRGKHGFSTLEYVIVITGVISVAVLFLRPSGPLSQAINVSYQTASNSMLEMGSRLAASRNSSGITSQRDDAQSGPITLMTSEARVDQ